MLLLIKFLWPYRSKKKTLSTLKKTYFTIDPMFIGNIIFLSQVQGHFCPWYSVWLSHYSWSGHVLWPLPGSLVSTSCWISPGSNGSLSLYLFMCHSSSCASHTCAQPTLSLFTHNPNISINVLIYSFAYYIARENLAQIIVFLLKKIIVPPSPSFSYLTPQHTKNSSMKVGVEQMRGYPDGCTFLENDSTPCLSLSRAKDIERDIVYLPG